MWWSTSLNPVCGRIRKKAHDLRPAQIKSWKHYLKNIYSKKAEDMTQVAECLPSKF
jgi:hypothetical protein